MAPKCGTADGRREGGVVRQTADGILLPLSVHGERLRGPVRRDFESYIITGTDSAGALSLKRESAAAAIKKAVELMADGCRDVSITNPDGCIYSHSDFDQLRAAERA